MKRAEGSSFTVAGDGGSLGAYDELMRAAEGLEEIEFERRTENDERVPSLAWGRYMDAYRRWQPQAVRELERVYPRGRA